MKLSWSHKLFLQINALQGRSRLIDEFFLLVTHWLIFGLLLFVVFWIGKYTPYPYVAAEILALGFVGVIAVNYSIAFIFRHPRPLREMPQIRQLFQPIEMWKSFPSDHAAVSAFLAFFLATIGAPALVVIGAAVVALLISLSRVYAGVHYPRDIIAGWLVALIIAFFGPSLYSGIMLFLERFL